MGSNNDSLEKPVHQVTIKESFYMGRYEVTQAEWQQVMGTNPSYLRGDRLPVEQVSWNDVQSFLTKLNERGDRFKYRLPSEAEWEYACRAGRTRDHAGDLNKMAWYVENSRLRTHAVGLKQPNAWGLTDMLGNVWEWCADYYHENYRGAPTDGSAWLTGGEMKERVDRGGSWANLATDVDLAIRTKGSPAEGDPYTGFRVVAVLRTQ
jgi:formylglycine-generating enzyme required for sulfatase activity